MHQVGPKDHGKSTYCDTARAIFSRGVVGGITPAGVVMHVAMFARGYVPTDRGPWWGAAHQLLQPRSSADLTASFNSIVLRTILIVLYGLGEAKDLVLQFHLDSI